MLRRRLKTVRRGSGAPFFGARPVAEDTGDGLSGAFVGRGTFAGDARVLAKLGGSFSGAASFAGNARVLAKLAGGFAGAATFSGEARALAKLSATFTGAGAFSGNARVIAKMGGSFAGAATFTGDIVDAAPGVTVWYAKPTATGTEDGTSWANADTLDGALASASDGEQVWAVAGTYSLKLTPNPGVTIYGGFNAASPQGSTGARDLENDITTVDGGSSDSCIEAYQSLSGAADWVFSDGVHYANGSEPDFSDYPNQGGVFTIEGIIANAVKVTFRNGSAIDNEGPLSACFCVIQNSVTPSAGEQVIRLENFIVAGGTGDIQAGAFHPDTELQVINCNVTDPETDAFEVLAAEDSGVVTVRNSNIRILHDAGAAYYTVDGGTFNTEYSNVSGGAAGTGNIDADPLWNDQPNGDWTLNSSSPCIDAGDGDEAPDTDMWLQARYDDGGTGAGTPDFTDIGPLEYQG